MRKKRTRRTLKKMEKILQYVSDMDALCGAERLIVADGKGKGTRLIRLYNGIAQLFIKEDKCLDIYRADFCGQNISYIGKNGLVSSELSNSDTVGFLNDFDGGLLFTCGLDNIGKCETRNGRNCIQHGSIAYTPAENVCINKSFSNGEYIVSVCGDIKYAALFGSKLVLHRKISMKYMSGEIKIENTIENQGFSDDEFMTLFHCNFGYPFINRDTKITVSKIEETIFVDEQAEKYQAERFNMSEPSVNCLEQVFAYKLGGDTATVNISNNNYSCEMSFKTSSLPYLTEWKSMRSGDYVLGIEPTMTLLNNKKAQKIKSGEKVIMDITLNLAKK